MENSHPDDSPCVDQGTLGRRNRLQILETVRGTSRANRSRMNVDFRGRKLGTILVAIGAIDGGQAAAALEYGDAIGCRFGEACLRLGLTVDGAIVRAMSLQAGIPSVALAGFEPDAASLARIPGWLARKHRVFPLSLSRTAGARDKMVLAAARPGDVAALDEVAFLTGCRVAPVVTSDVDLDEAIDRYYAENSIDLENGPGLEHVVERYFDARP